jgi:hypothetical protein
LAAHGGEGAVVSVRVVGAGDAECGEGEGVGDCGHPGLVVGKVVSVDG